MVTITITRNNSWNCGFRTARIMGDNVEIGRVICGESVNLQVPENTSNLYVKIDWLRSSPYPVSKIKDGQIIYMNARYSLNSFRYGGIMWGLPIKLEDTPLRGNKMNAWFSLLTDHISAFKLYLVQFKHGVKKILYQSSMSKQYRNEGIMRLPIKLEDSPLRGNKMYCSNCGKGILDNAFACIHCGYASNTENKFCNHCGEATNEKQVICTKCGMSLPKGKDSNVGRTKHFEVWGRKTTAGILGILLGGVGVHKFFHGSWGWGLIYLLLFWTFIPAIIGFIEGIVYLAMDENKYRVKYLSGDNGAFSW